ncbi:8-amino-7-oxononanoate synthase [Geitlerinema sp. P-1104]|uniref:8-amino-7-oxononanoate synthase n=1 Tax=Geitlerinema sp. P-1104 TaxID=2546230 RepID=UPI001476A5FB|nr:8-amino-7-oxononanoate synthase [Geitlerinema sp. P-1104]NMG59653.1 8-amino-7-oxononanoate synthase [Geitlerinema sp. P-1104]
MSSYSWIERSLATIHKANWYRQVQPISGRGGVEVNLNGSPVINFASNDYLGLAGDERLIEAAIAATQEYGTGSTGSRLLSGHRPLHRQLEEAIARLKQTEDAIVFSSGYLANLGTLAALVGPRDVIFADAYNHSSLRQGSLLSGATVEEYPHGDVEALRQQMQQRHQFRRGLIVSDGVFSMDGDLCPLPQLLDLAQEYDCMLLIDDAHGTGVLGSRGAGTVDHFDCGDRPLIQMGTLSKALGSLGGYVAGDAVLIDYLRNRAPTWIYTTGLSPADTAAALAAIALVEEEPQRRQQLRQHQDYLKQKLNSILSLKSQLLPTESPILCIQLKDAAQAIHCGQALREAGLFVSAVRPPTVPTSRLRITLMANHEPQHLDRLSESLQTLAL